MSDLLNGLSSSYGAANTTRASSLNYGGDNNTLDMSDFLYLMVQQFQNQGIDSQADTSDMLNQLVQMSVVQAVTTITDATTLMYSASLVGKEVTIGTYDSEGKMQEMVGVVTGTGSYNGEQIIFVNGKGYALSSIMAIGRLPEPETPEEPGDTEDPSEKPDDPTDKPEDGTEQSPAV